MDDLLVERQMDRLVQFFKPGLELRGRPYAADEEAIARRTAAPLANRCVGGDPRTHVVNPLGDVGVAFVELQPTVVIQLEVVMRVDESWQHIPAVCVGCCGKLGAGVFLGGKNPDVGYGSLLLIQYLPAQCAAKFLCRQHASNRKQQRGGR